MTTNNFQKKEIRDRMAETGEAYSIAARAIARESTWVSFPWFSFNKLAGKINPQGLYVFASRNGVGKTTVALNLALHLVEQGGIAYYANMEMTESQLRNRIIATGAGISPLDLEAKPINESVAKKIETFNNSFRGDIVIDKTATSQTVDNIIAETRKLATGGNLKVIVIDYLQLLEPIFGTSADRNNAIAETVHKLHLLTIELKVPIVILSQVLRSSAEISVVYAFSRTANIDLVQSSQLVVLIEESVKDTLTFHVTKNRSKRTGSVKLAINREFMQVKDIS